MNQELSNVPAGFRKGRGTGCQIANIRWITEKAREFQKNIYFCFILTMSKPLTVWITTNCGKFFNRWECQTTWPASWGICMQVRKQQLELDVKKQTGYKSRKESVKVVYISWEMPGWMKHKLESRLLGEISITSYMLITPPLCQKAKRNWRASWWKWKSWHKTQHSEN